MNTYYNYQSYYFLALILKTFEIDIDRFRQIEAKVVAF